MKASRIAIATLAALAAAMQSPALAQPAPEADFSPARVLVKFKQGQDARTADRLLDRAGVRVSRTMRASRVSLLEITDKQKTVKQVLTELVESGQVEYAEPDYLIQLDATYPGDPGFGQLWGLHNTGASGGSDDADIDAPEAWDRATGDPGMVVAVIDTGVDYTHEDLAANMWVNLGEVVNGIDDDGNGYVDDIHGINAITSSGDPWDDHYHGTHVAGTIGAVADNGVGVAGVIWDVQIMALKFLDANGSGYTSDAIECLEYATLMRTVYGIDIRLTNNSWGGSGYSQALEDAIEAAGEAGILFVAAAGNSGLDTDVTPHYPSSYDLDVVVSVAATDHNDALVYFSNHGEVSVDLAAPGVSVYSCLPGHSYGYLSGTSMASPHVTGAAALIWGSHPDAGPAEIKQVLLDSTDPVAALTGRMRTGGRLNVASAFGACESGDPLLSTLPGNGFTAELGVPFEVEVSVFDCGAAISGATVTITPEGSSVAIDARDDGVQPDVTADDGFYTASWTPGEPGSTSLFVEAQVAGATLSATLEGTVIELPDYVVSDEEEFAWIDASVGAFAGVVFDDSGVVIPIGFEFPFYGELHDQITVSSNGYLTFGTSGTTYANSPIPSSVQPNDLIAAYWDDLNPSTAGQVYYLLEGQAPNRTLTVAWLGVAYFGSADTVTFEVTLHEGTGDIVLQYLDVGAGAAAYGASATVGIEDAAGVMGLQVSYAQAALEDEMAIRIHDAPDCSDGRDNDGDGHVDHPDDPGCTDSEDDSETDPEPEPDPEPDPDGDLDGDGILNRYDNCREIPNGQQLDNDRDGYGNLCDADYDQDGWTGLADFNAFRAVFGSSRRDGRYRRNYDHDRDGHIGTFDFNVLRTCFGQEPGPSGLECAGTQGCRAD